MSPHGGSGGYSVKKGHSAGAAFMVRAYTGAEIVTEAELRAIVMPAVERAVASALGKELG